jgi:hypothetical protein
MAARRSSRRVALARRLLRVLIVSVAVCLGGALASSTRIILGYTELVTGPWWSLCRKMQLIKGSAFGHMTGKRDSFTEAVLTNELHVELNARTSCSPVAPAKPRLRVPRLLRVSKRSLARVSLHHLTIRNSAIRAVRI